MKSHPRLNRMNIGLCNASRCDQKYVCGDDDGDDADGGHCLLISWMVAPTRPSNTLANTTAILGLGVDDDDHGVDDDDLGVDDDDHGVDDGDS